MPNMKINGKEIGFEPGQTIVEAAAAAGIEIPTLCWLKKGDNHSVCRICSVEVKGADRLLPGCSTPANEGMDVQTHSPAVMEVRKDILSMIIAEGRHDCFMRKLPKENWPPYQKAASERANRENPCQADGDCRLQDLVLEYAVPVAALVPSEDPNWPLDNEQPMIVRDFSRCIQCGRCAAACEHIQVNEAIPVQFGRREETGGAWWPVVDYDKCVHCGECLQVCPTGALSSKKRGALATKDDKLEKIRTTCPYCGVGCQQELVMKDGKIIEVNGVETAHNEGRLCVKGRFGYDFIYSPERLTDPLIKQEDGSFKKASWDEALDLVADKFKTFIKESGPDSLAGVSCARSINEDSYQMQKLFRAVFKTNNIDHCART